MHPLALAAAITHKEGDQLALYSVVATIIPVLYIAVLYQSRLFEIVRRVQYAQLVAAVVIALLAVIGEIASLSALVSQEPNDPERLGSLVAVSALGTYVLSIPMLIGAAELSHHRQRLMAAAAVAVTMTTLWCVGFVLLLVDNT
jgi:NADH:ubiquinone oxidoreductase subunit 6 (subunit J)